MQQYKFVGIAAWVEGLFVLSGRKPGVLSKNLAFFGLGSKRLFGGLTSSAWLVALAELRALLGTLDWLGRWDQMLLTVANQVRFAHLLKCFT